ncbi:secretin N-terminal domain-containing protein [Leeia aquatica]|uniref:General secretion pathway protein GspD n=1 Tax=Leeia aquatica TaxID=2725557 RepID=A0A847SEW1_9NEIS|nr:secretin N-terminal domain-containing protein [Leeia aquatica]NLR75748.1 general secretion pathway protein GspD [Leeia aquatica]
MLLLLAGCAGSSEHSNGLSQMQAGNAEAGLQQLARAVELDPDNAQYRADYRRQRELFIQRQWVEADRLRQQGNWDAARQTLQRLLTIDPDNLRAKDTLRNLNDEQALREQLQDVATLIGDKKLSEARGRLQPLRQRYPGNRDIERQWRKLDELQPPALLPPALQTALAKPISLEFRDVPVRQVFEILARNANLNFIFDRDVRSDLRTTLMLKNVRIEDVLRLVLTTSQLERKVLSDNMLLIYPRTPEKQREYEDLVSRTFYLNTASAKDTAALIKSFSKTQAIYVDERNNALTIRDTPEALQYIEKLVTSQDQANPEVMLDVEILEVSSNLMDEIGIRYPGSASFSIQGAAGTPGTVTMKEWHNRSSSLVSINIGNPALLLNLKEEAGRANLLANPRIRVKNREKAKIHIGDKVPLITSNITANSTISESVSYIDVGLKLDVEPTVRPLEDVEIKVGLEVSNLVDKTTTANGTLAYRIGTRNTSTVLTLQDGETQVLAGLISDQDRNSVTGLPGLGRLPLLGRLFSSHKDESSRTEIVMLITPHILRNINPEASTTQFLSGTESKPGAEPLQLKSRSTLTPASGSESSPPGSNPAGNTNPESELDLQQPAAITLSAPLFTKVGEELLIQLNLSKPQTIKGFLTQLNFDPFRFEPISVDIPPALQAKLAENGLHNGMDAQQGRVSLATEWKSELPAGPLLLVKLKTKPGAPGSTTLMLGGITAQDGKGQPLPLEPAVPLRITITP